MENTTQHTPEPWSNAPLAKGSIIISEADWKRAVECVNACAGMFAPSVEIPMIRLHSVETQDKLSTARGELKSIRAYIGANSDESTYDEVCNLFDSHKRHIESCLQWERTMNMAIGEDGPGSVAHAITDLKSSVKMLSKVLRSFLTAHENDSITPENVSQAKVALMMYEPDEPKVKSELLYIQMVGRCVRIIKSMETEILDDVSTDEPTPLTLTNKYFENAGKINGETMMDTGELANGISRRKIFIHALSAYKTLYPNIRTVFYLDGRISVEQINGNEVTVIKTATPVV